MNNDELKKKLIKIIRQGFATADCRKPYTNVPYPYFDSQIFCIADALIAAGIGDTSDLEVKCEVLQRDVDNLTRTMEEGAEEMKEERHRAEVEEKALRVLARKFIIFAFPNGDWKELIEQLVSEVKEQAEKELAEERKEL